MSIFEEDKINYQNNKYKNDSYENNKLMNTEAILKKLLINIEAFKKIEQENNELKKQLIANQNLLKFDYKRKFSELNKLLKEKEDIKEKVKTELLLKYRSYLEKITKEFLRLKQENVLLKKKYFDIYELVKKTNEENKKLRIVLINNRNLARIEFEKKLFKILKEHKDNKTLLEAKHKSILKEYETHKLELKEKYEIEKQKNISLYEKYEKLRTLFEKREAEFKKIILLNKKLLKRVEYLEKNSLGNENVLKARTELIKKAFEDKLKEVVKENLGKEIEYKAKINSLMEDLTKYYEELKQSKLKYYKREKEIKEKLKELIK